MPQWAETLVWVAGAVAAVGIIWTKMVRPLVRAVSLAERMLPLIADLTKQFEDQPGAFAVLNEIAAQFRTDSGSSLRDQVNLLVTAAHDTKVAAEVLAVGVEAVKQLAAQDRADATRRQRQIEDLAAKIADKQERPP